MDIIEIPVKCQSVIETQSEINIPASRGRRSSNTSSSVSKRHRNDSSTELDVLETRGHEREKLMSSISKSMEADCDSASIFFKSIAMTVKKIPPYLIVKANASLLKLINDL